MSLRPMLVAVPPSGPSRLKASRYTKLDCPGVPAYVSTNTSVLEPPDVSVKAKDPPGGSMLKGSSISTSAKSGVIPGPQKAALQKPVPFGLKVKLPEKVTG